MAIPATIARFLDEGQARYSVLPHALAFTAQRTAEAAHVPGRVFAKTVVCLADGAPVLAVLPAPLAVDLAALASLAGARDVRLAREEDLAGLFPDCEVGAMPPLGPMYGQPVYVERALRDDPEIVFDGGSHREAIRMRYADFARLVKPVVGSFGRPATMH